MKINKRLKNGQELTLRKMTPGRALEIRKMLSEGLDPVIVAAALRLPFKDVIRVTNEYLRDATKRDGKERADLPDSLQEYLALAAQIKKANDDLSKKNAIQTTDGEVLQFDVEEKP